MAKRTYPTIWVKAAPSPVLCLQGKERVRMPWNNSRHITSTPVELEKTPDVVRMLLLGDIVEVETEETTAPRPSRRSEQP